MIIKLMEPELNEIQLAKLKNVLQTILRTSRNAPPNDELIERFIRHKKLVGLKDTSLTSYVNEVRRLQQYVGKGFCGITTADMKDYFATIVAENHISAVTLQSRIRYISSFYDFLTNEEYIDRNPTDKIERVMVEKKIKKAFSEADIEALRNGNNNFDYTWQSVINFWKAFNQGVLSKNPNAYTVAEITDEGDLHRIGLGHWSDKFHSQNDIIQKFQRETGITSTAMYSYFFSDLQEMFAI